VDKEAIILFTKKIDSRIRSRVEGGVVFQEKIDDFEDLDGFLDELADLYIAGSEVDRSQLRQWTAIETFDWFVPQYLSRKSAHIASSNEPKSVLFRALAVAALFDQRNGQHEFEELLAYLFRAAQKAKILDPQYLFDKAAEISATDGNPSTFELFKTFWNRDSCRRLSYFPIPDLEKLIRSSDLDRMRQLKREGFDFGKFFEGLRTPLMVAAEIGNPDVVLMLLEFRVGINHKDKSGRTALNFAAEKNHRAAAEILLNFAHKK